MKVTFKVQKKDSMTRTEREAHLCLPVRVREEEIAQLRPGKGYSGPGDKIGKGTDVRSIRSTAGRTVKGLV